jgi:hypothetical protein
VLGALSLLAGEVFGDFWCAPALESPLPEEDAFGASWWAGAGFGALPLPEDEEPDDSWCAGDGAGLLPPPEPPPPEPPPPGPPATPAGLRFHVNGRVGDTSATSRTDVAPSASRTGDTAPTAAGDNPGPATTNAAPVPSATASRGTPDDSAVASGARDANATPKTARTQRREDTAHPQVGQAGTRSEEKIDRTTRCTH